MAAGQTQEPALMYDPPAGQDPVAVVTALRLAGLSAATSLVAGRGVVEIVVGDSDPRELRERAREVIARDAAGSISEDEPGPHVPVRFADESSSSA